MYSVNIEPHRRGTRGLGDRIPDRLSTSTTSRSAASARSCSQQDPLRFQALPHMMSAQWDCLELIMESLSRDYPQHFSLDATGQPLALDQPAARARPDVHLRRSGDAAAASRSNTSRARCRATGWSWTSAKTICGPKRGMVTTQADWSLDFDIGMSFKEWHGPVPLAHEMGVFDRALKFLLNLRLNEPVRRLNWTMTVNPRLDTSPENYHKWGPDRASVTPQNVGDKVHLRVELQGLWRLPRSNGIVFSVRGYLISMRELATIPKVGAARASRAARPASGARGLQGAHALPGYGGRVSCAIRRWRADHAGHRAGIDAQASTSYNDSSRRDAHGIELALLGSG